MYGMGTLKKLENGKNKIVYLEVVKAKTFFRNIFENLQLCLEWEFRLFGSCN